MNEQRSIQPQETEQEKAERISSRSSEQTGNGKAYPPFKIVLPAMAAIYLTIFLIALDRTILGTAIPAIANDFSSFGDIAWYEAGFLLPLCALQLSFGRVYTYYPTKWVLIALVSIFEIGSIVCATAPNSNALIIGRVITGIGGAGTSPGALLLITKLIPLQTRPKWTGGIGAVFGIASILGPILGGYLTAVTWRWCFWINVPVGGLSLILLIFLTPNDPPAVKPAPTWQGKLDQLDPFGFTLIAGSIICLLFSLEWGGSRYAWGSGRIIALLVIFGILLLAFVGFQIFRKGNATVPPNIISQRSILAGSIATLGIGSLLVIFAFYLPIWFQVLQGKSPQSSGLSLLPLLLSNVLAVIASGVATSVLGYYTAFLILGSALLIVGSALITTKKYDIGAGVWIGYQVIVGAGLGLTLQQPNIAAQVVLPDDEVPIGLSLLAFISFLGGTTFITVAQTLFENQLMNRLRFIIPDLDPSSIANGGATTLRDMVPESQLPEVLVAYNESMNSIWYLTLGLSCLVFVAAWVMEWKSVKAKKEDPGNIEKEEA